MQVEETYYLAVPGQENTNYFRIRVLGKAAGESKYNGGWYPADAVDQLFGEITDSSEPASKQTKESIRTAYNEAILSATQSYLEAAKKPDATVEDLSNRLAAIRRVRATAGDEIALPPGAVEVEYNPAASLSVRRAGEKLVLILSGNPSKTIEAIQGIAVADESR